MGDARRCTVRRMRATGIRIELQSTNILLGMSRTTNQGGVGSNPAWRAIKFKELG